MTLKEKILKEMDITNPRTLTEVEKARLTEFNAKDQDKQFWQLPYKTMSNKPEQERKQHKNDAKTKYEPQNAIEIEAYEKGYKLKKFKPYDERQKTFYINGKQDRLNYKKQKYTVKELEQ